MKAHCSLINVNPSSIILVTASRGGKVVLSMSPLALPQIKRNKCLSSPTAEKRGSLKNTGTENSLNLVENENESGLWTSTQLHTA